jgi:hypothetical protein
MLGVALRTDKEIFFPRDITGTALASKFFLGFVFCHDAILLDFSVVGSQPIISNLINLSRKARARDDFSGWRNPAGVDTPGKGRLYRLTSGQTFTTSQVKKGR